jgi:hypothetical protein
MVQSTSCVLCSTALSAEHPSHHLTIGSVAYRGVENGERTGETHGTRARHVDRGAVDRRHTDAVDLDDVVVVECADVSMLGGGAVAAVRVAGGHVHAS